MLTQHPVQLTLKVSSVGESLTSLEKLFQWIIPIVHIVKNFSLASNQNLPRSNLYPLSLIFSMCLLVNKESPCFLLEVKLLWQFTNQLFLHWWRICIFINLSFCPEGQGPNSAGKDRGEEKGWEPLSFQHYWSLIFLSWLLLVVVGFAFVGISKSGEVDLTYGILLRISVTLLWNLNQYVL